MKKEKFVCEYCGETFKNEVDLQTHQFNNKHCSERERVKCPECLTLVRQDELNMFGGLCENCATTE